MCAYTIYNGVKYAYIYLHLCSLSRAIHSATTSHVELIDHKLYLAL